MNEPHFFRFATVVAASDKTKAENCQMLDGMISKIEMARNWLVRILGSNVI